MIAELNPALQAFDPLAHGDDPPLYEIIDGKRVELPPMSILANQVSSDLQIHLGHYVLSNRLGRALMETLFQLTPSADRYRRPDVAYVSAKTIAEAPPQPGSDDAWAVLPELMAEVISPSNRFEEILERVHEYFDAGAKLVWLVSPTHRLVYVYDSPRKVSILGEGDDLTGGTVLPGFRFPLTSLFSA